jgi:hypothetical protein
MTPTSEAFPMLKEIKGVEIFSTGTWNGDPYTTDDLDEMVKAYSEMQSTLKPALKFGHTAEQKLLQADGMPAAGWIGALYRKGDKLVADFVDMPRQVYELIQKKAYKKVSSEVFWNIEIAGKKYKRMLAAVALLGADTPAVMNLKDILAMYGLQDGAIKSYATDESAITIRQYTTEPLSEADDMKTAEQLAKELEAAQAEAKTYSDEKAALKAEADAAKAEVIQLKEFKAAAEARAAEAEKAAAEQALDASVEAMVAEKTISKAMKPYIRTLLGEEKKEYALKVGDKDEKLSKADLLKSILKLHAEAAKVNFVESSVDGDKGGAGEKNSDAAVADKITKYMADNDVDYGAAYRAVMKTVESKA